MTLVDEVRQKVKDLGEEWTVRDLERAAFANAVSTNLSLPLESVVANNGSGKEDALNAENPETGQPHSEEPQKSDEPPTEDKKTEKSTSKDAKIAEGTTQALMTEKPKPNEAKGAEEKTETVGREDTAAVGTSFANGNVEDDQDTGRGKAKRTLKRKAGPAKRDSKSGSSQATRKSARVQRK